MIFIAPNIPEETTTITPEEPSSCDVCTGVPVQFVNAETCVCSPPLCWSGSKCVSRSECPCFEDNTPYGIGATYQTELCSDCTCKIGGIPDCKPKICQQCANGLRRESPSSCSCKCVQCPPETPVLCQTSGECIVETLWCDGILDCPDDEEYCMNTNITTSSTVIGLTEICQSPKCPSDFELKEIKSRGFSSLFSYR